MSDTLAMWATAAWAIISSIAWQTTLIFYDTSIYLLFGMVIGGLLHEFVPTDFIVRHLAARNFRSIVTAAIFGAPIPLCSCAVLPTAVALQKKGAGKPALASLLISTPETGAPLPFTRRPSFRSWSRSPRSQSKPGT